MTMYGIAASSIACFVGGYFAFGFGDCVLTNRRETAGLLTMWAGLIGIWASGWFL